MEFISNRDFLEMSLIASAFLLNLSSTGYSGTFFKTPASMLFSLSSASSNNAVLIRLVISAEIGQGELKETV